METSIIKQDINLLGSSTAFDKLRNSTILITGSTGIIGSLFVRGMLAYNDVQGGNIRVIALARSQSKAESVFDGWLGRSDFRIIYGDLNDLSVIDEPVHWISHGASITSSAAFASNPVEVSLTEIYGTKNILEFAQKNNVRGMVYLSSLEVYGDVPEAHGKVSEEYCGPLDRFTVRNSYPVSKRMCESLCVSYASEYGVPVKIARLAQTFGAGVSKNDSRVFAYIARCVVDGHDIVLRTPGLGCRCYCYTTDAIEGIAAVLTKGAVANAYNVSNEETYCNVRDMAHMVANAFGGNKTSVVFDIPDDVSSFGFAAPSFVRLDSSKLEALGWSPKYNLEAMYERLIGGLTDNA